jgi:ferredoxin
MNANWQQWAACRTADPDLFTPPDGQKQTVTEATERYAIREYCGVCPVVAECLANAVTLKMQGVAGGMTEADRRRMETNRRVRQARAEKREAS